MNRNTLLVQLSKTTETKRTSAENLLSLLEYDGLYKVKTKLAHIKGVSNVLNEMFLQCRKQISVSLLVL